MTLKVLIVHNTYTHTGGEDSVVKAEAELLRRTGIEVAVYYYNNPKSKVRQAFSLLMEPFNILQYFRFKKKLRELQPQVIHLHNWHFQASPSIIWAARASGIPVVMTVHNYRLLCPSATLFHNNELFLYSLKEKYFTSAIRHKVYHESYFITGILAFTLITNKLINTWAQVTKFIFLNDFMADLHKASYLKLAEAQIMLKPNFVVNEKTSEVNLSENRSGFLFVGRLSVEKGIDVLLKAFRDTSYHLKIIGDGPMRPEVLEVVSKFQNIEYLGFKKKDEILAVMEKCEALIFPSIWYEGMPITILEAFSCGTPVVASNIGSLRSLIEDQKNGFHFEAGNWEELQKKLSYLHSLDTTVKDTLYQTVFSIYKNHYTAAKNVDKLISVYKEAAQY